jgi:hypothetical protein
MPASESISIFGNDGLLGFSIAAVSMAWRLLSTVVSLLPAYLRLQCAFRNCGGKSLP